MLHEIVKMLLLLLVADLAAAVPFTIFQNYTISTVGVVVDDMQVIAGVDLCYGICELEAKGYNGAVEDNIQVSEMFQNLRRWLVALM